MQLRSKSSSSSLLALVLLHALVHLALLGNENGQGQGLVTAQKKFQLFSRAPKSEDKPVVGSLQNQQIVANLKALSSSSSSSSEQKNKADEVEDEDKKKKRLSKGKGIENLLKVVVADSLSSPPSHESTVVAAVAGSGSGSGTGVSAILSDMEQKKKIAEPQKNSKESTGHEDDIVHDFDHADNEAYDDIVWYDGPHRDDEDDHEDDHHDDDHHDENKGEAGEDEGHPSKSVLKTRPDVLFNLKNLGGAKVGGSGSGPGLGPGPGMAARTGTVTGAGTQSVFDRDPHNAIKNDKNKNDNDHDHDQFDGNGEAGSVRVFHHSGAEALSGTISATEFCLRLKHECESTCREFKAGVEHLSVTCEAGSVAELLFWGRCCQIGQEHRARKHSTRPLKSTAEASNPLKPAAGAGAGAAGSGDLEEQHLQWQRKRHQAQQQLLQPEKQLK